MKSYGIDSMSHPNDLTGFGTANFCGVAEYGQVLRRVSSRSFMRVRDEEQLRQTRVAADPCRIRIYRSVIPEGVYIFNGNDVISYYRWAANRACATAALHRHKLTFLGKSRKLLELAAKEFTATVLSIVVTFRQEMTPPSTSVRQKIG